MILNDLINIKVSSKTFSHYKKISENIKVGDVIKISVDQLPKSSAVIILVKCDICGAEYSITYQKYNKNISKYNIYTCGKCSYIKNKKTSRIKYNDENFNNREKAKITLLKEYNVDNVSKVSEVKLKKESTTFKNYSVLNPMQNEEIKLKTRKIILERYGGIQSDFIQNKKKQTNLIKYGVENPFSNDLIKGKLKKIHNDKTLESYKNFNIISLTDDIYTFKCDCNKEHNYNISAKNFYNRKQIDTVLCTICNPINSYFSSGSEIRLQKFISDNYNDQIIKNTKKIIKPQELDIYLPELKLAFEFNGLFWHNELKKESTYHLNKTELCEKQGIQLIHIYEDDWKYRQDIVKSIILNKLGKTSSEIYAVETKIIEITDIELVRNFLNKNHIQGFVDSKINIGLYNNNELVSLMIFNIVDDKYELSRFCNKIYTNIIGGFSKLLKYFIENYKSQEIIAYSDRSVSQGKLYEFFGFKLQEKIKPNYYYIIKDLRKHRIENNTDRKIYKIYDSGSLKYNYIA